MYAKLAKPFLDITISVIAFIFLLPLFIFTLVILLFNNNGKAFFLQKRPGLYGKIFKIIKFKTMTDKRDINNHLLPDSERLTSVGLFIRKTSLDEIPQLLNVIKGDMSLIGPRPLLPEYIPLYSQEQNKRHLVRPGITGWAQVNGRNAISWQSKFKLDVWYVQNLSFFLDLKILFLTFKKVFKSEGISSDTNLTMEKFTGNR